MNLLPVLFLLVFYFLSSKNDGIHMIRRGLSVALHQQASL